MNDLIDFPLVFFSDLDSNFLENVLEVPEIACHRLTSIIVCTVCLDKSLTDRGILSWLRPVVTLNLGTILFKRA